MNEHELRRALTGHAAAVRPAADPDRLQAAMVWTDRLRLARTAGATALCSIVVVLGFFAAQAGEAATSLDVVDSPDSPDLSPQPRFDLPDLDAAVAESTTTAPPATSTSVAPLAAPGHLDGAPTTTAAPAIVSTTTAPATTTVAPTTTTTATATAVAFTASARYGSCEEDPPYDEYSGTATPGATITVSSAWNTTTTTTADGAGHWFVRVEFPDAPVGEPFGVTVSDGSATAVFDFVRTA